jgi:hypothetical protein
MLHGAPGAVPYISGGIGKEDVQRMERESRPYNLRMAFSEGRHNEFIAGAHLHITDTKGREVLKLADAGPITDVKLPAGRYRVDVTYEGHTRTSQVMLKDHQPLQLDLHWAGEGQEA